MKRDNMDLNLFKTFYVVAKYKSFTQASNELFVSQPAITQSIKKLEEQLNVKLFDRGINGIVLTKAGEIVFHYAEQLFNLASSVDQLMKYVEITNSPAINVGLPTHIGTFYFVEVLEKFCKKYPDIKINIINSKSADMLKMLESRNLDLIIDTDIPFSDNKEIIIEKIKDLDGCFVGGPEYKEIATGLPISPTKLTKYPLILPSKFTSTRKALDDNFKMKNVIIDSFIEVNSSSISRGLILNNLGIGWMIKDFVKTTLEEQRLFEIKVDVDVVSSSLDIAYHKNYVDAIVHDLINIIKKH